MSTGSTHGDRQQRCAMADASVAATGSLGQEQLHVTSFMIIGVFTPVGCTVLTRMLYAPSSIASVRISPTTPCLAAV